MPHDPQAVWEEVQAGLRGFVAKRVADAADVDDILQEVFLRMHRKLNSLKDSGKVVSWLYQITRHVLVDHARSPVRRREQPAGLAGDIEGADTRGVHSATPDDAAPSDPRTELAGCLRPMIDRLAPAYRQAVTLVELEGLTQQAAATRLGLSLPGMKSRVQRGRRQLKSMLNACCAIQLDRRRSVIDYAPHRRQDNDCACINSAQKRESSR